MSDSILPITWKAGEQVVGKFDFAARSDEDLSFRKEEVLTITKSTRDPMWYHASNQQGKEGMIPANYVSPNKSLIDNSEINSFKKQLWYHGKISREEATKRLEKNSNNGSFLLRDSSNYPGDFTLCLIFDKTVENYHIEKTNTGCWTIDNETTFTTVQKLIDHYSKDADGLVTNLVKPVPVFNNMDYVIPLSQLTINECIGKGEFGEVHIGLFKGNKVAIKSLIDETKASEFLKEATFMMTLDHKNLVKLVGIVRGDSLLIVSEFMDIGCVVDFLRSRGRSKINKEQLLAFACDTCDAMKYLEAKKVVHRDLAARNVLLKELPEATGGYVAKVADFGLARDKLDTDSQGGKFPVKWTAPEALKDHSKFTSKSDVWSFGIFLWELYSFGRVPYPRIPLNDVIEHVQKGYRMEPPDECPPEIHSVMLVTWQLKPEKRPTFEDIRNTLSKIKPTN